MAGTQAPKYFDRGRSGGLGWRRRLSGKRKGVKKETEC